MQLFIQGANTVAYVEISSTGEIACMGFDLLHAFYKSWQATEIFVQKKKNIAFYYHWW